VSHSDIEQPRSISSQVADDGIEGDNFFSHFAAEGDKHDEDSSQLEIEARSSGETKSQPEPESPVVEQTASLAAAIPRKDQTKSNEDKFDLVEAVWKPLAGIALSVFWLVVTVIVIAMSIPSGSGYSSYGNRFLSDNAIGATANATEWIAHQQPKAGNSLVTNLLLLVIVNQLLKLNRNISDKNRNGD